MRKLIPYLKNATAQKDYKLLVEFEDGISGIIDLEKWKDVFKAWENEESFKHFKITDDKKIEWSEQIDMDPDAFYLQLVGKTFDEYAGNQQLLRNTD